MLCRPALLSRSEGDKISPMEQPLNEAAAEVLIRRAATLPAGIEYRSHCWRRMAERRIDALDVARLLRNAELVCPAYRRSGEWRYRVRERPGNAPPERRDLAVIVVVIREDRVACQTVYRGRR
jgi:hypothetical protein